MGGGGGVGLYKKISRNFSNFELLKETSCQYENKNTLFQTNIFINTSVDKAFETMEITLFEKK